MAFLELRKFNFFELVRNVDSDKIKECLKDRKVVASGSGNGHLVFGDSEGSIHIISKGFNVVTLNAFILRVCLVQMMQHAPLLVAIGEDECGINPLIKVWNIEKLDKQGLPMCVRISRTIPNNRPTPVSVLCAHEDLNLLAVGFTDGSIILYYGDIARDRSSKPRLIQDGGGGKQPITGLAFRSTLKLTFLLVATSSHVISYNVTTKDQIQKVVLDPEEQDEIHCSTSTDSTHDGQFVVGRDKAVFCYTPDGRGPCYAFKGVKVLLEWYRNYLVIVTKDTVIGTSISPSLLDRSSYSSSNTSADVHIVTVLDIQNSFIVLQTPIQDVTSVLSEWGSLYVLSGKTQPCLILLQERDLQSKLSVLFQKRLFDVAIRIARSHQYDDDGLADIFQQYGDYLYKEKKNYAGAIEQYIKTIGRLEPSYVIKRFLDSQHIENLTTYLEALHKQGHATPDHTTLLMNCYTKLDKTDKLKEFIQTKDRADFEVEIAIKVCRQASKEDALILAQKHGMHDWYLKIQIEDCADYKTALEYIGNLDFSEAETYTKKYGCILLQNCPTEATELLKRLCTDYRPSNKPLVDSNMLKGGLNPLVDSANPADFIDLFTKCPEQLEEFLEYLLKENTEWNPLLYNTLLEHYLNSWGNLMCVGTVETTRRLQHETRIMQLLQDSKSRYDRDQVLILCQANNFRPGILYLLKESHMYHQILQYHMSHRDYKEVLATCQNFGKQDPNLWVQALWNCARDSHTPPSVLEEILQVIEKNKSLPPLLVLDALLSSSEVTLANVRSYLKNVLSGERELAKREQERMEEYKKESEHIRQRIHDIQTKSVIFQVSRCSACNQPMELPSIHFLCMHSYHQHCFQSFSENEKECPSCLPINKEILDKIKSREQSRNIHEDFHKLLDQAEDGLSVVADYFGRGVFNKLTVITDSPKQFSRPPQVQKSTYGPGAEARIRLEEQPSSFTSKKETLSYGGNYSQLNVSSSLPHSSRISPSQIRKDLATLSLGEHDSQSKLNKQIHSEIQPAVSVSRSRTPEPRSRTPELRAVVAAGATPQNQTKKSTLSKVEKKPTNPFEDEKTCDAFDSKNPFAEDYHSDGSGDSAGLLKAALKPKNPFDEPDDYDKEKNPFGCS